MDKKELTVEEKNISMQIVENMLDLVGSNVESVKECGIFIDEYYKLPMEKREVICEDSYMYFKENGSFDINCIFALIAHEAVNAEDERSRDSKNKVNSKKH